MASGSPDSLIGHLVQQVRARHQRGAPLRQAGVGDVAVHQRDLPPNLLLAVVVVAHGDHVGGKVHADHAPRVRHGLGQQAGAGANATPEVHDDPALLDLMGGMDPRCGGCMSGLMSQHGVADLGCGLLRRRELNEGGTG